MGTFFAYKGNLFDGNVSKTQYRRGGDPSWYTIVHCVRPRQSFHIAVWRSLQRKMGSQVKLSTTYHPQTDGQSERTIQTLEDMLRAYALDFSGPWEGHLPLIEFAYKSNYHTSIRAAPYEVLYGRKCRTLLCWNEVREKQLAGLEIV